MTEPTHDTGGAADDGSTGIPAEPAAIPEDTITAGATAEAGIAEAGIAEAGTAGAETAGAETAEAGIAEAGIAEAGTAEAGTAEAGTADGAIPEGAPADGAISDDTTAQDPTPTRPRSAVRRLAAPLIALALALAALIVFGVTLSGPGNARPRAADGAPGGPRPGTATPMAPAHGPTIATADIQTLADRRARALIGRDEPAFTVDLDPDVPELLPGQLRLFRNLGRITFDQLGYRVETVQTMPTADDRTVAYVDVSFDHRVSGADTATVGEGYRWTVVRAGPGAPLRITAVDGTPYDGAGYAYARDYPAPWDHADLTVVRRDHVVVLADPATAPGADRLADDAEQAARADLDTWADGGPPGTAPGFVIVPVADRDTFYRLYGGRTGDHGEESGLTYALRTVGAGGKGRFGGSRIVLDTTSGWFTSPNPRRLGELLRHEMAHALVTPLRNEVPNQDQPVWVVEGFADWLALRGRTLLGTDELYEARTYLAANRFTGKLPTDNELYQADTVGNAAAYELAHLAIRRIEELGGTAAVYDFVTAVYADPAPAAVDTALGRATGLPRARFEADWATRVHALLDA
ncbi:hypothetical protein [Embleya sp. AB8]|uniref:hypothetical protein n=1 Tax=Embleya sp. AB8 TaxID=3156304 RepID=UPI003C71863B